MRESTADVLEHLPHYEKRITELTEPIIANLVMISEIPAPTFGEQERMNFMVNRLTEGGLQNCSTDEMGNALGILPGKTGERNIMIVAHLDTLFDESVDHSVSVQPDKIIGPGVGDNGMGLAVIASLPLILEHLGLQLDSNLVLMGSAQSLGKGNIEGLRFFLSNSDIPVHAAICTEGVEIGRLSYASIGMMRCEIDITIPEEYDWTRFGASGALIIMNRVMNKILALPIPKQPQTSILIGAARGGTSFNTIATHAKIQFEIRSESDTMVEELAAKIDNIAEEISAETNAEVKLNILAKRRPGGINFSSPLVEQARKIFKKLHIKHRILPSTSELAAFIDKGIPAVTIGITNGENMDKMNEAIKIRPIYRGITQLVGLIRALDNGCCDEP